MATWLEASQQGGIRATYCLVSFVLPAESAVIQWLTDRYMVRHDADNSGEPEFVFFASVVEQAIGKRLEVIMRDASDRPFAVPTEISALISKKFTLPFTLNEKGLHYGQLSFHVNNTSTKTSVQASKVNTIGNDKEPEDRDMDNSNESGNEGHISPTVDSREHIASFLPRNRKHHLLKLLLQAKMIHTH
ncbi:uncharacterized protein LOC119289945 [Triticum dicoccoides]|uniref:uncharacterized protein LOC119289945 n=1 Tax=Triticum dicoccoides TaxID=85692 RepID=UPI000E7C4AF9|nr:uncharacterized protein LOC119289945 [Triticum dicoccoides]